MSAVSLGGAGGGPGQDTTSGAAVGVEKPCLYPFGRAGAASAGVCVILSRLVNTVIVTGLGPEVHQQSKAARTCLAAWGSLALCGDAGVCRERLALLHHLCMFGPPLLPPALVVSHLRQLLTGPSVQPVPWIGTTAAAPGCGWIGRDAEAGGSGANADPAWCGGAAPVLFAARATAGGGAAIDAALTSSHGDGGWSAPSTVAAELAPLFFALSGYGCGAGGWLVRGSLAARPSALVAWPSGAASCSAPVPYAEQALATIFTAHTGVPHCTTPPAATSGAGAGGGTPAGSTPAVNGVAWLGLLASGTMQADGGAAAACPTAASLLRVPPALLGDAAGQLRSAGVCSWGVGADLCVGGSSGPGLASSGGTACSAPTVAMALEALLLVAQRNASHLVSSGVMCDLWLALGVGLAADQASVLDKIGWTTVQVLANGGTADGGATCSCALHVDGGTVWGDVFGTGAGERGGASRCLSACSQRTMHDGRTAAASSRMPVRATALQSATLDALATFLRVVDTTSGSSAAHAPRVAGHGGGSARLPWLDVCLAVAGHGRSTAVLLPVALAAGTTPGAASLSADGGDDDDDSEYDASSGASGDEHGAPAAMPSPGTAAIDGESFDLEALVGLDGCSVAQARALGATAGLNGSLWAAVTSGGLGAGAKVVALYILRHFVAQWATARLEARENNPLIAVQLETVLGVAMTLAFPSSSHASMSVGTAPAVHLAALQLLTATVQALHPVPEGWLGCPPSRRRSMAPSELSMLEQYQVQLCSVAGGCLKSFVASLRAGGGDEVSMPGCTVAALPLVCRLVVQLVVSGLSGSPSSTLRLVKQLLSAHDVLCRGKGGAASGSPNHQAWALVCVSSALAAVYAHASRVVHAHRLENAATSEVWASLSSTVRPVAPGVQPARALATATTLLNHVHASSALPFSTTSMLRRMWSSIVAAVTPASSDAPLGWLRVPGVDDVKLVGDDGVGTTQVSRAVHQCWPHVAEAALWLVAASASSHSGDPAGVGLLWHAVAHLSSAPRGVAANDEPLAPPLDAFGSIAMCSDSQGMRHCSVEGLRGLGQLPRLGAHRLLLALLVSAPMASPQATIPEQLVASSDLAAGVQRLLLPCASASAGTDADDDGTAARAVALGFASWFVSGRPATLPGSGQAGDEASADDNVTDHGDTLVAHVPFVVMALRCMHTHAVPLPLTLPPWLMTLAAGFGEALATQPALCSAVQDHELSRDLLAEFTNRLLARARVEVETFVQGPHDANGIQAPCLVAACILEASCGGGGSRAWSTVQVALRAMLAAASTRAEAWRAVFDFCTPMCEHQQDAAAATSLLAGVARAWAAAVRGVCAEASSNAPGKRAWLHCQSAVQGMAEWLALPSARASPLRPHLLVRLSECTGVLVQFVGLSTAVAADGHSDGEVAAATRVARQCVIFIGVMLSGETGPATSDRFTVASTCVTLLAMVLCAARGLAPHAAALGVASDLAPLVTAVADTCFAIAKSDATAFKSALASLPGDRRQVRGCDVVSCLGRALTFVVCAAA